MGDEIALGDNGQVVIEISSYAQYALMADLIASYAQENDLDDATAALLRELFTRIVEQWNETQGVDLIATIPDEDFIRQVAEEFIADLQSESANPPETDEGEAGIEAIDEQSLEEKIAAVEAVIYTEEGMMAEDVFTLLEALRENVQVDQILNVRTIERNVTVRVDELTYVHRSGMLYNSMGQLLSYTEALDHPLDNTREIFMRNDIQYDSLGRLVNYHESVTMTGVAVEEGVLNYNLLETLGNCFS